jgi:hypothetical protein
MMQIDDKLDQPVLDSHAFLSFSGDAQRMFSGGNSFSWCSAEGKIPADRQPASAEKWGDSADRKPSPSNVTDRHDHFQPIASPFFSGHNK